MNIVKCKNGHFYDADKYVNCPFCSETPDSLILLRVCEPMKKIIFNGKNYFIVGRDYDSCDLVLEADCISGMHAQFYYENEIEKSWFIKDLNSLNGTFINGVKIDVDAVYKLETNAMISFALNENFIFVESRNNLKITLDDNTPEWDYTLTYYYDDYNIPARYEDASWSDVYRYNKNGVLISCLKGVPVLNKSEKRHYPYIKEDQVKDMVCVYASPDIMERRK